MKEYIRKLLVSLKRSPQTIALIVLALAFVYYSFNLTQISNTTAYIQGSGMGLSAFVIMLFSVLAMVCFLNSFPRRKRANVPMLVLLFVMLGVTLFCNLNYQKCIDVAYGNWNRQYLVSAQRSVAQAQTGAAQAERDAAAAEKHHAEAVKHAKKAAEIYDATVAAAATTTAGETAAQNAVKNAEKALNAANAAVDAAAAEVTKAKDAAEKAKAGAAEAIAMGTLDEVNTKARAANSAVTTAAKSAEAAKAACDKAAAAVAQAEAALQTVDVWERIESLEQQVVILSAGGQGNTTAAAPSAAASAATELDISAVELEPAVVEEALQKGADAVAKTETDRPYIKTAAHVLSVHRILLLAAVALTALLPVYKPLIRKINTSVEVEANENMGAIELDGSDN